MRNRRRRSLYGQARDADGILDLSDAQIGDAGAQAIAKALKANTRLTWLDLSNNQIGDSGVQAIAKSLKANETLTGLHLSNNQIGDSGVQAIAKSLKANETLTGLHLAGNRIGDAGAQAIAEVLKVNSTLTELSLHENQIGDVGAQGVAEALKVNSKLNQLSLRSNCIGNLGFQALDETSKVTCRIEIDRYYDQVNPLAFSLLPRLATAKDIQKVFRMLTSGLELENQPACLPALPTEIAGLIMDEAHYWQGVLRTKRGDSDVDILKVTVPQRDSIRVKAIQVLRDWSSELDDIDDCAFDLTVQDEQGAVRYECAVHPTFVNSNLTLATIEPATTPILRQMREGWQVRFLLNDCGDALFEAVYVGYV
ncbi:hypothetical protein CAOG_06510 [Capsaspora owczarzaki ATCC 30864]|uniref:NOD3 protein n=1 Tax=Capsaspora owczarzaki (strain ATCC 30864) TaxID=595528 RepID=A0A0D2WU79_CAPO3|nr:hypothetical protein CAOG_06510 [Capsaspora owczarzaki ATCC 30864]KJE96145.1 hypothetical protein CAOG_006510 [Capsaspora owczarzaki ATCC 30864]|eukprot:XP_004345259.2 hypothetical protein CAOG_06510 [Capsaspora owczarzaki ATCC 30864]